MSGVGDQDTRRAPPICPTDVQFAPKVALARALKPMGDASASVARNVPADPFEQLTVPDALP
jgi:hypothetical protein